MITFAHPWNRTLSALMGLAVLSAALCSGTPAWAQGGDMQILLDRLERLERDIRTLNQQIARGAGNGDVTAPATAASPPAANKPKIEFQEGEGALTRVTVRMSALEEEVRHATGLAEGMSYRVEQISARLDKLITDLDYRLARLEGGAMGSLSSAHGQQPMVSAAPSPPSVSKVGEMAAPTAGLPVQSTPGQQMTGTVGKDGTFKPSSGGGTLGSISKNTLDQLMPTDEGATASGAEPAQQPAAQQQAALTPAQPAQASAPQTASEPAAAPASATVLPDGTPREQYQYAFGLMSQARYDDAEVALKEFIAAHGEDALAGNAWYWLGETYYVRKSFMEAAQTFFQAYKTAPEGAKAPDSLLKLGMSMANLDKVEEACTTFGKLRKEFVDLKSSITKTLNRETKRLKCQ